MQNIYYNDIMKVNNLRFFYNLTDLNILFLFYNKRKSLSISAHGLQSDNQKNHNAEGLLDNYSDLKHVISVKDSSGRRFLLAPFDEGLMQLGPFLFEEDPYPRQRLGSSYQIDIPIRTLDKIRAYRQLLNLQVQPDDFKDESLEHLDIQDSVIQSTEEINTEEIEKRYGSERYIRHLIATGSKDEMREALKNISTSIDFKSRMPNNPLRVFKNMSIVLNSIGRLSAEKGGLPPYLLHSISEKFAIMIEEQSSVEEINRLQREMLLNYCDAVYYYGIENQSSYVVKACQYILMNLNIKLELSDIAGNSGVHPSYLSRRFKEETGQTISSYIREKRIMEARWMLSQTKESITDIALSLGFEDINYFSKIFRKERGLSPSEYRRSKGNDDFDGIPDK